MRIRWRILLAFIALNALSFAYLVQWVRDDLKPRFREAIEEPLVDIAAALSAVAGRCWKDEFPAFSLLADALAEAKKRPLSAAIYEHQKGSADLRVYITDKDGIVVFDSDGGRDVGRDYSQWNDVYLTLRGKYGARTTHDDPANPEHSVLYVGAPIAGEHGIRGVLTVGKSAKSANELTARAKQRVLFTAVLIASGVCLLAWLLSLWLTRPLSLLTRYVNDVRDGKRAVLPKTLSAELALLGESFEQMRQALEGKKYVEHCVETLTHELKGPLAAIRGSAELLHESLPAERKARFIENIEQESIRISDIVDRLLSISALECRQELRETRPVDLGRLASSLIEELEPVLRRKDLQIKLKAEQDCILEGEEFLLRQCIANIVSNAMEFSPDRGSIEISISRDKEEFEICVSDRGSGIPEYALSRVWDKFYSLPRPETGRKSSGLGLVFVREAVALHNGTAQILNRPEGGVQVMLRFPIAAERPAS